MYEMIEKGLRGGMTQCAHKKVEANNEYMNEQYDMSKPSSYISYLDANNLYGLAMSKNYRLIISIGIFQAWMRRNYLVIVMMITKVIF